MKDALQDLEETYIRAPFDGIVTVKAAQPGEIVSPVSAGGGFTRTGIGTVVDMTSLFVEVEIGEASLQRLRVGQAAAIFLNSYPQDPLAGRVIAIVPTADRSKGTIKTRIAFEESDARVLPEMGARVSFRDGDASFAHSLRQGMTTE